MTPISSSTQSTTCLLLVAIKKRLCSIRVARDGLLTYRNPASILQNDAASIHNSRDYLLAYGIPAMTQAVGKNPLGLNGQEYNLQDIYIDRFPNVRWARTSTMFNNRWLHSDVKDVAYPFVRAFYKDILEKGIPK